MPDIDLSLLTPRTQLAADSFVVMREGAPDAMGLLNALSALPFANSAGPAVPANGVVHFSKKIAGHDFAHTIGPGNEPRALQSLMIRSGSGAWLPGSGATTSPGVFGMPNFTITGFTATARSCATTNYFSRRRKLGYVTAATAGAVGMWRAGTNAYSIGSGAGVGGFFAVVRFGISDGAAVTGARMFMGIGVSTVAPTNVEPSTLINRIGIGHGAADTTMQLYYGGTTAQTPINLGVNFPANTLSVDMYELALFAPANSQVVNYEVTRLNTGDVATGTLSGLVGTVVPAATELMHFTSYRTNNATALAVSIDIAGAYIEMLDE